MTEKDRRELPYLHSEETDKPKIQVNGVFFYNAFLDQTYANQVAGALRANRKLGGYNISIEPAQIDAETLEDAKTRIQALNPHFVIISPPTYTANKDQRNYYEWLKEYCKEGQIEIINCVLMAEDLGNNDQNTVVLDETSFDPTSTNEQRKLSDRIVALLTSPNPDRNSQN